MKRPSFDPTAARDERSADGAPSTTVSLDEWRERLRRDPRATVAVLLRGFAERRSVVPGVEDFFWRVLADHGTPDELVRAVLGRLRAPGVEDLAVTLELGAREPAAAGRLLDIDREHRVRVRGRLRVEATDALKGFVRTAEERERIAADPVRLPEAAFARRGRWPEAAALFVLEHDHLSAPEPARERLARASLRYELARGLHRVEGKQGRALEVMESALVLVGSGDRGDDRGLGAWGTLAARLAFHAREWLGLRHYDAGRYRDAEGEFRAAADEAPATDLALAALMFAANAMIRDGRQAEARELLDAIEPHAGGVGEDLSEQWHELRSGLMETSGDRDDAD